MGFLCQGSQKRHGGKNNRAKFEDNASPVCDVCCVNMALRREERVLTGHPSLPQPPRGAEEETKKGQEVEKSGLIIFSLPLPPHSRPDGGEWVGVVNSLGFVRSPGAV